MIMDLNAQIGSLVAKERTQIACQRHQATGSHDVGAAHDFTT